MAKSDVFDELTALLLREHGGDLQSALMAAEDAAANGGTNRATMAIITTRLRAMGAAHPTGAQRCDGCGVLRTGRCMGCARWAEDGAAGRLGPQEPPRVFCGTCRTDAVAGTICDHCGALT